MKKPAHLSLIALLAALPLTLVACGGGGSPAELTSQAHEALNSGDHAGALAKFRKALEGMTPADEGYLEAKLGAIQARISGDPEGAQAEFLELAASQSEAVDARRYSFVGGHMANSKQWLPAIAVVDAGIKRFGKGEPKLMALLEKIKKESAGDAAATSALAGLGYL